MPKPSSKTKTVNGKLTEAKSGPPLWDSAPVDRIAPGLAELAVPIGDLVPDPDNARIHGERNMFALKDSLALYGQLKPVVVREETGVVMAGNGTLQAARELGWTVLAASRVSMTDEDAVGYALADNRTAELAEWDYEVVARLSKMQEELGGSAVGWTADELAALRGEMPEQRWEDVWQGMPAFSTEEQTAEVQLIVNLKSREDLNRLLKLLGYPDGGGWGRASSTRQRPSVWWPKIATIKTGECKQS